MSATVTRKFIRLGQSTFASEDEFRRTIEKRGYHVVEVKCDGDHLFAWCIYIRNLRKEVRSHAKTITKMPLGDTVHWHTFG